MLLVLLILVVALYLGHQLWLKQRTLRLAQHPRPEAVPLPPAVADERIQVQLAPAPQAVAIPGSPYTSVLARINQLIQEGKAVDAQAQLSAIPSEAAVDLPIRLSLSTLWNNLGVLQARNGGGLGAGTAAFNTAVAINPQNGAAYLNLVLAYWELKDATLTADMLERAMRLVPEDPMPHLILAERLIQKDDLSSATLHLEQAKTRVAGSPQAQAYLDSQIVYIEKARKAEQRFQARDSGHFTVKYDGGEDYAVWTRVLDILEEAYREIGQQLGHYPSDPILVVLHTRESFHGATGGPAWSDGLYDPTLGRIKIPTQGALTDQAWLARVLRHEYVHALLDHRLQGRRLPQWLNEGLAMQLAGDPPPDIPAFVRGQVTLVNLSYLEGPWGGFPPQQAMVAYLEGNSATKYLIDRFGMSTVRELVERIAKGEPFPSAFYDRVFISYEEFQRRWVEHLNETLQMERT